MEGEKSISKIIYLVGVVVLIGLLVIGGRILYKSSAKKAGLKKEMIGRTEETQLEKGAFDEIKIEKYLEIKEGVEGDSGPAEKSLLTPEDKKKEITENQARGIEQVRSGLELIDKMLSEKELDNEEREALMRERELFQEALEILEGKSK